MAYALSPIFDTILSITLLSFCASIVSSQTAIDGIWLDDFFVDANQLNGWYIYNQIPTNPVNTITKGSIDYHGKFARIGDGKENYMKRYFECVADSKLYISYKFAYCKTELTDTTTMQWIGPNSQTKSIKHGMDKSALPDIHTDLSTIETSTIFSENIKPIRSECESQNEWNYISVNDEYVGTVDAGISWQLTFTQKLSKSNEYALLFDISANCDRLAPIPVAPVIPDPPLVAPPVVDPPIIEPAVVESPKPVTQTEVPLFEASKPINPETINIIGGEFCCHTSRDLEIWNGYCMMKSSAVECNFVPNNRCDWKANDCFSNPQCLERNEACNNDNQCCSKGCLFRDAINGGGGKCR